MQGCWPRRALNSCRWRQRRTPARAGRANRRRGWLARLWAGGGKEGKGEREGEGLGVSKKGEKVRKKWVGLGEGKERRGFKVEEWWGIGGLPSERLKKKTLFTVSFTLNLTITLKHLPQYFNMMHFQIPVRSTRKSETHTFIWSLKNTQMKQKSLKVPVLSQESKHSCDPTTVRKSPTGTWLNRQKVYRKYNTCVFCCHRKNCSVANREEGVLLQVYWLMVSVLCEIYPSAGMIWYMQEKPLLSKR